MHFHAQVLGVAKNVSGLFNFTCFTVNHKQKIVRMDRGFILQGAVVRNSQSIKASPNCAKAANQNGTFEPTHNPGDHWARSEHWTNSGNRKNSGANQ